MRATPPPPDASRRNFLALAWKTCLALTGLLGLGGLVRFLNFRTAPAAKTEFDLGPADQYAPGSRTVLAEAQAILVRTPAGFEAYSAVCPHLGCEVAPEPGGGFACPCHGSRFDAHGALVKGPAASSLRALRVEQAGDGHLILHTNA